MRGEYTVGLDILALKFKAAGFALDRNVTDWLRLLNGETTTFYERASNRGNLRIWGGASTALFAILEPTPDTLAFADETWHEAIAAIHDDGTIDSEMRRAHRALIYHMYSLSATLVLRSARAGLGRPATPQETARLALLANEIGKTLCDPSTMEGPAHAAQEIPGDWAYRVPIGFGGDLLNADWARCGRPHAGLSDPSTGGDTRRSAVVLSALAE